MVVQSTHIPSNEGGIKPSHIFTVVQSTGPTNYHCRRFYWTVQVIVGSAATAMCHSWVNWGHESSSNWMWKLFLGVLKLPHVIPRLGYLHGFCGASPGKKQYWLVSSLLWGRPVHKCHFPHGLVPGHLPKCLHKFHALELLSPLSGPQFYFGEPIQNLVQWWALMGCHVLADMGKCGKLARWASIWQANGDALMAWGQSLLSVSYC